jgi:CTP synthase (UTP-ammonia lyase)
VLGPNSRSRRCGIAPDDGSGDSRWECMQPAPAVSLYTLLKAKSMASLSIGIIGDYDEAKETHVASAPALQHAGASLDQEIQSIWIPTENIGSHDPAMVTGFDGLLIAPGGPYRNTEGALCAIRYARTHDVHLLASCGGFQYVIVEFARNVLGIKNAEHAESAPHAQHRVITPLACSLMGQSALVEVRTGSKAARAYGRVTESTERFFCSFGVNPEYVDMFVDAGLIISGSDQLGDPRIVELQHLRFFLATLFVPQTSSTLRRPHPLLVGFVAASSRVFSSPSLDVDFQRSQSDRSSRP